MFAKNNTKSIIEKLQRHERCELYSFRCHFGPYRNYLYKYCTRDEEEIKKRYQIGGTEFWARIKELGTATPPTGWCPRFEARLKR